jgi:probable F420-dependent oxidoreductase
VQLGLFGANMGAYPNGSSVAAVARAAEDAGFDSLWMGEHVVLPDPRVPPSPMEPGDDALDPVIALTYAAAVTTRLRLATGIIIMPQRNPVVLAKELASLDVLSGGRLVFGAGVGYLEPEFRAIGANFHARGAVTDEFLDAIALLWYSERPAYDGRFVAFSGVDAHPRPVQQPVPVVIGGHSAAAFRRAVARAHGWFGFALDRKGAAACLAQLAEARQQVDRPSGLGELEVTVAPRGPLTRERVDAFAEFGVHRLVALPAPGSGRDELLSTIEQAAHTVD